MSATDANEWQVITFLVAADPDRAQELPERARAGLAEASTALNATRYLVIPAVALGSGNHDVSSVRPATEGQSSFDISAEIFLPDRPAAHAVAAALAEFSAGLRDIVDAAASVAFVGKQVINKPDRGALKYMSMFTRLPQVAHEDAMKAWEAQVGPNLATHPTAVGYIQQQGDPTLTKAAISATGYGGGEFSGVAIEWFRTLEDTLGSMEWAWDPRSSALADEPSDRGIIGVISRYFDIINNGKTMFGVEPAPTV